MHAELLKKIDEMIESCEENLIQDTVRLVNIDSSQGTPLPGAPFGAGPRKVLDTVLEMGEQKGFCVTDHQVGVVSLSFIPDSRIWASGLTAMWCRQGTDGSFRLIMQHGTKDASLAEV